MWYIISRYWYENNKLQIEELHGGVFDDAEQAKEYAELHYSLMPGERWCVESCLSKQALTRAKRLAKKQSDTFDAWPVTEFVAFMNLPVYQGKRIKW